MKTKFKQTKIGLVPQEWDVVSFSSLFEQTQSGLSRKLSHTDIGLPVIRSNNICEEKLVFDNVKYWFRDDNQGAKTENYFLNDGDILVNFINSIAQIGKSALFENELKRETIFTTNLMRIKLKKNIFPKIFLAHTSSERYKYFIQAISKPAVNQASFTLSDYGRYKIPLPTLREQEKISDILSAWEENIELLKKLIEKKEIRYRAFAQKFLSGKQGLKNYIIEISVKNKNNKLNNVLSVTNSKGFVNQDEQFERVIASKNLKTYKIVKKGQFAYNPSRINVGSVAVLDNFEQGIVSPLYIVFETDEKKLLRDYFKHYFKTQDFFEQMKIYIQGGVRDSLGFDGLQMMRVNIPPLSLQKKYAEILDTLVEEISLLKRQLEMLKIQKKGLTDKLITGKVRV